MYMSDNAVDELLEDVQLGVNDVESGPILDADDGSGHIPFEIETEPVFNQLADKMYESDEAALREGLTNAVTAVIRAINREHISEEDGVIELSYYEGNSPSDSGTLVLRDNGIGMSWTEIQDVVSKIGATTARADGDLAGQFGMGFLALFKLVGLDGVFVMHTNSRLTDNDPFTGLWNQGGFNRDTDEKFTNPFASDEYGVQFEFPLKDDVDGSDIEGWVQNVKWSRIPVVYERYGPDGSQKFNDELGGRNIRSVLSDDKPFAEYEDEYVHAVTAPNSYQHDKTILLDVPIRRNALRTALDDLPWGKAALVRLKNENGVVVEGPHEGLMTVKAAEYKNMSPDRKTKFVRTDELVDDDIVMPGPRGNRDVLDNNPEFWEWLSAKLAADYDAQLQELVNRVDDFDDLLSLSSSETKLLSPNLPGVPEEVEEFDESDRKLPRYDPDEYADAYREAFDDTIDEMTAKRMNLSRLSVKRVEPGCSDAETARNHTEMPLFEVLHKAQGNGSDGDIFMGVTMNHDRCSVVWDDNDDNEVIVVDGTDWYPVLDNVFGIRKLKRVTTSRLDEFDVSDDVRKQFLADSDDESSSNVTPVEDKIVTLHLGRDGRKQQTKTTNIGVGTLQDECEEADEGEPLSVGHYSYPTRVIAFPRQDDHNLGDYKLWLSTNDIAAMSVTSQEWDYLEGTPRIIHISEYIDEAEQIEFPTSDGEHTVSEAKEAGNFVIHLVPDDVLPLFRDEIVMERVAEMLAEEDWSAENWRWTVTDTIDADEPLVYAPMSRDMFDRIRPLTNDGETFVVVDEATYTYGDPGKKLSTPPDTVLYAGARLGDWHDTPELTVIEGGLCKLGDNLGTGTETDSDVLSLIDTLSMLHDSGVQPASQQ